MSEEKAPKGPRVIDAGTFSPAPRNVFRYNGEAYPAFDILQVKRGVRNKVANLQEHMTKCQNVDEQIDIAVSLIAGFVPSAPIEALRDEPVEMLIDALIHLYVAIGEDGEERPTTGQ